MSSQRVEGEKSQQLSTTNESISNRSNIEESVKKQIRSAFIDQQLVKCEKEFCSFHNLRILSGTWNVNGKLDEEDVQALIKHEGLRLFDMYVFGIQEMVPLTISSVLFNHNVEKKRKQWIDCILSVLRSIHGIKFDCIASKSLVGVCLFIIVPSSTKFHFSNIQVSSLPVGYYGLLANKGAVAISVTVNDSPISFVCCHLSPHQYNEHLRNLEMKRILSEIEVSSQSLQQETTILLMGDLNYRLTKKVSIKNLPNPITSLLQYDQLLSLLNTSSTWREFSEEAIQFPPTYKYKAHSNEWNKKRSPAWCDRILMKGSWKCHSYRSMMKETCSDHKPVTAIVETEVKTINERKQVEKRNEISQQIEKNEKQEGRIEIEETELDFGDVYKKEKKMKVLHLSNPSSSNAYYQIELTEGSKPWFTISPMQGLIEPGKKEEIQVSVECSPQQTRNIIRGYEMFNSQFILQTEEKQMMIPCNGKLHSTSIQSTNFSCKSYLWICSCMATAFVIDLLQHLLIVCLI